MKWSLDELVEAVKSNTTMSGVLRDLCIGVHGGNYKSVWNHIVDNNLDVSHFRTPSASPGVAKSLPEMLTANGPRVPSSRLKRRMIAAGMLDDFCSLCGQKPMWNGKLLTLQLDHINGNNTDNTVGNLRVVCPNCHTQTDTYGSKNWDDRTKKCQCGLKIKKSSKMCHTCALTNRRKSRLCIANCGRTTSRPNSACALCTTSQLHGHGCIISWPKLDDIIAEVLDTSYSAVARRLGVSDKAVAKHIMKCKSRIVSDKVPSAPAVL